jgi:hypothetical protein
MLESFFRDPTKLPEVPQPEPDTRLELALFCWLGLFASFVAAVVGWIAGWHVVMWWGFGLAFVFYVLGGWLLPEARRG